MDHPDGVPGDAHARSVALAMERVRAGVSIGSATLTAGNQLVSEHPAEEGLHSVLCSRGLEQHSGMHSTTPFKALVSAHGLRSVLS